MTTEDRIIQTKVWLSKANRFPFFGYLLFMLIPRPTKEMVQTAGVGLDGQYLYYGEEFMGKLNDESMRAVLVHEVLHCLTPDSLVLTESGLKPIKDIQVGERVWSKDGMFTKVLAKSERDYKGKVYTFKSRFGLPVTFTDEHPILAIKNHHNRNIGAIKALEKRKRHSLGKASFRFFKAKDIEKGDILSFTPPLYHGKNPEKLFKTRKHYKIHKVFLDKDIAYFLGFFVGDGSLHKHKSSGPWFKKGEKFERGVCLTLSLKDDAERLMRIVKNKFYRSPCLIKIKDKKAVRICFSGKGLAKFLRNNFYDGKQKRIPTWMLYEKESIIKAFIKGLEDADGYCDKSGMHSITNTAKGVYSFIPLLVMKMGYFPSLMACKMQEIHRSQPYKIQWIEKRKLENAKFIGRKIIYPLVSKQEKYYSGKVYNLETAASTYCVPYFTTHNCALGHLWRVGARDPMLFNMAADLAINGEINEYAEMRLPKGCLLDRKYKGWATEQIYNDLLKKMNQAVKQGGGKQGKGKGGKGGRGTGKVMGKIRMGFADGKGGQEDHDIEIVEGGSPGGCRGDHSQWRKGKQNKKIQKKWERAVRQAAEAHAKKQGNLPGELQRLVEEAMPVVDWREVLVNYVVKSHDDFSYRQPDRRFLDSEFIMPSMEEGEKIEEVVVAVDCSGSIDQDLLNKFAGEVKGLLKAFNHVKIYFCSWDMQVYDWSEIDNYQVNIQYFGGGGTSTLCVFDEIEKRNIDPACVIFFTDLYAEFPEKCPSYDVIWLTPKRDHGESPGWGRVILYNE